MGANRIITCLSDMKDWCRVIHSTITKSRLYAVWTLSVGILVSGCAALTGDAIRYHVFDYPSPQRDVTSTIPETLMVYRFLLADSVDVRELTVSESQGDGRVLERHRWEQNPADMVTELIIRDIKSSGLFEKTVDQSSSSQYRYALEGTLLKLQGRKSGGRAWADLEAEVTLLDFESGWGAKTSIMKKHYTMEAPSINNTPESIVAAINQAVRTFSNRVRSDIRSALEQSRTPRDENTIPKPSGSTVRIGAVMTVPAV